MITKWRVPTRRIGQSACSTPVAQSVAVRSSKRWVGAVTPGTGRGADRDQLPDGLSPREVEVLRLVAAGSSNRQIGAALFISPNTAANHIRAILQKTGCANRAEAAAYAARHALLDA